MRQIGHVPPRLGLLGRRASGLAAPEVGPRANTGAQAAEELDEDLEEPSSLKLSTQITEVALEGRVVSLRGPARLLGASVCSRV
jgi:hypothetical protein